ncbi:MAG: Tpl protein [Candidatus Cloacimonadota bacterium]|nr:MAG: Tpl protein [Candidatus Cloacimonadota bacterium]
MKRIVEVEFKAGRREFYHIDNDLEFSPNQYVVVEAERGINLGKVIQYITVNQEEEAIDYNDLFSIIRVANDDDLKKLDKIHKKERRASVIFQDRLLRFPIELFLVDTEYQFDGNRVTFYFTAGGRVDFREFVRDLASIFKTRIELRQINPREEARRLGGIGVCGREYCCTIFKKNSVQVTLQMAKDQNLTTNLSKISGPCGRLLCCLSFEENFYLDIADKFPSIGTEIEYNYKKVKVMKNHYLTNNVRVRTQENVDIVIPLEEFRKAEKTTAYCHKDT